MFNMNTTLSNSVNTMVANDIKNITVIYIQSTLNCAIACIKTAQSNFDLKFINVKTNQMLMLCYIYEI